MATQLLPGVKLDVISEPLNVVYSKLQGQINKKPGLYSVVIKHEDVTDEG